MEIYVKKNQKPSHKMSTQERDTLKEKEEHLEAQLQLAKDPTFGHLSKDTSAIRSESARVKDALGRDEELAAKGKEKDRLKARNKELAAILKEKVPPLWLQKAKSGSPDYVKAVAACEKTNADKEVPKLYEEYQTNARRLEPDDSSAGHIGEIVNK